jgi:predicted amidohydrolase YtcJ
MTPPETLYHSCTVHTMDDAVSRADAFLVRDERFAAVGTRDEVEAAAGRGATRVDLEGRTVVPGFNDSHCHILDLGLALDRIDVSADAVRTVEDIRRAVAARAVDTRHGEWITGRGYDQNALPGLRHPDRRDLDAASPGNPVVLHHTSGHVLTCNSRALELAGVHAGTPVPSGGEIERDERGEPTGVLKEAAMELVGRAIPPPSVERATEAIIAAMSAMSGVGVTSASDAATGDHDTLEPYLEAYRRAATSGRLSGRITLMPQIYFTAPPDSQDVRRADELDAGKHPDRLRIGATKVFSDGALSTRTAALRQPYADNPNNMGILLWDLAVLRSMIQRAHRAGWQIATHALGDRAVEAVLEAYESALEADRRADHRHRIEHCMIADEALARRIKRLGIVPSLQPDIFRLGDGYVAGLGIERASASIPVGLFRRLGVPMAFSSDAPVIPCDPLQVIRSAVVRRTPRGINLGREHAATVMEAVSLYTRGGAFATRTESSVGRIAPGLLADFVVLSRDPAALPMDEFSSLRVVTTFVGGRRASGEALAPSPLEGEGVGG